MGKALNVYKDRGLFVNVHFHHLTLFKGRVMRAKNKKSAKSIPARRSPLQQNLKNIFTGGSPKIPQSITISHHPIMETKAINVNLKQKTN